MTAIIRRSMAPGNPLERSLFPLLAVALALTSASITDCAGRADRHAVSITNARVFDGQRVLPSLTTVVVEGDRIAEVSEKAAPRGEVVDAHGRAIIPGLFDSHMHAGDGVRVLTQEAVFGVTTSLGMFDDPEVARRLRPESVVRSGFKSAGLGATVPGGHGTEYGGDPIPTVSGAEDADRFVANRIAEGSDFLKIIMGPPRMPMLREDVVRALVDAAHKRGRLAMAHIDRLSEAKIAVRAGIDGLVHIFCDEVADQVFVDQLLLQKVFVIPTLTIRQAATAGAEWQGNGKSLLEDDAVTPYLPKTDREEAANRYVGNDSWRAVASDNVSILFKRGVTLMAGSDAPNPGTVWGASLHQELQLLVASGLSPAAALTAATQTPARIFGFPDRGRIAPGMLADLVMLDCDPLADIRCTTKIAVVWRRGLRIDRVAGQAADSPEFEQRR